MPQFQPPLLEVVESNIFGLHGRRVVSVPQDIDGTPQSIQDVRTEDDASFVVRPPDSPTFLRQSFPGPISIASALEGAELAPGNRATLGALRNTDRRTQSARSTLFQLDEDRFLKNLRSARRGAAAGPSGMTNEHLRPLLDDARGRKLLFTVGEQLARAAVPQEVIEMVRVGRLTALTKPDGGVRGMRYGSTSCRPHHRAATGNHRGEGHCPIPVRVEHGRGASASHTLCKD